jgi:hypothetical protein
MQCNTCEADSLYTGEEVAETQAQGVNGTSQETNSHLELERRLGIKTLPRLGSPVNSHW